MSEYIIPGDQVRLLGSDEDEIFVVTQVEGTRLGVKDSKGDWGVIRTYEVELV